jgi:IS605 OrfB family transposase
MPIDTVFTQSTRLPASVSPVMEAMAAWYQTWLRKSHRIITRAMIGDDAVKDPHAAKLNGMQHVRTAMGDIPSWVKDSLLQDLSGQMSSRSACWSLEIRSKRDAIEKMTACQTRRRRALSTLVKRRDADLTSIRTATKRRKASKRSIIARERMPETLKQIRMLRFTIHQKERRIRYLQHRVEYLTRQGPRICFGGRTLAHAQHDLAANDYDDHAAWLRAWRAVRSNGFLIVGRAREPGGNRHAQIRRQDDGSMTLHLTIPPQVVAALADQQIPCGSNITMPITLRNHDALFTFVDGERVPTSVTVRIHRGKRGWYAAVTTTVSVADPQPGVTTMGIDLNPGSIDLAIVDDHGDLTTTHSIPLSLAGTKGQIQHRIRHAVIDTVEMAKRHNASIAMEDLDFSRKKVALKETCSKSSRRMLTGFAYSAMQNAMIARCRKHGVVLTGVNPAYTSTIGLTVHMGRHGLHGQTAAAMAVAQRLNGYDAQVPGALAACTQVDVQAPLAQQWRQVHAALGRAARAHGKPWPRHIWRVRSGAIPVDVATWLSRCQKPMHASVSEAPVPS